MVVVLGVVVVMFVFDFGKGVVDDFVVVDEDGVFGVEFVEVCLDWWSGGIGGDDVVFVFGCGDVLEVEVGEFCVFELGDGVLDGGDDFG